MAAEGFHGPDSVHGPDAATPIVCTCDPFHRTVSSVPGERSKAMRGPSGDQTGFRPTGATCGSPEPSALMTQIPCNWKASREPAGDHCGWAPLGTSVSPEPSTPTIQTPLPYRPLNARREPSDDQPRSSTCPNFAWTTIGSDAPAPSASTRSTRSSAFAACSVTAWTACSRISRSCAPCPDASYRADSVSRSMRPRGYATSTACSRRRASCSILLPMNEARAGQPPSLHGCLGAAYACGRADVCELRSGESG
jgi:hypothetical protein